MGGAHGKDRVYINGVLTGDTTMNLLSAGFQAGAEAYSEIIFFRDKAELALGGNHLTKSPTNWIF